MRVANDAVDSAFLIYLKYIDNYGFTIRFKLSFASFIQWGRGEFDDSHTYARIYYPVSMTALAIIPYDVIRNPSNGAWPISMQTGYTNTSVVFTTTTKNTIGAFGWVGIGTV